MIEGVLNMYKIIKTYGANEPWWFFEDWREEIVSVQEFDTFEKAICAFRKEWKTLEASTDEVNSKKNFLSAFWKKDDLVWCEECDEDLQQYHGLMLLENDQPIPEKVGLALFDRTSCASKSKVCSIRI
jgi:hypothetical protein